MNISRSKAFLITGTFICLLPMVNPVGALTLGIAGAVFLKVEKDLQKVTSLLLKGSVVLLGFGLSWSEATTSTSKVLALTGTSVLCTWAIGLLIGKFLKTDKKTGLLTSIGTAICGGSAIAAMSPVISAEKEQMSLSLTVVFVLNGVALLVFPAIGNALGLSQEVFGAWAAMAIHDTSSVVGAASIYGDVALEIATTMKLTRALWIIPMVVLYGIFLTGRDWKKVSPPWFILLFVLAMISANYIGQLIVIFDFLKLAGKKGMVLVLFLVGTSFDMSALRIAGAKNILHGVILWVIVSALSLLLLFSTH